MKMKKWAAAALALCLTLSLTACGSDAGAVYVQSVAEYRLLCHWVDAQLFVFFDYHVDLLFFHTAVDAQSAEGHSHTFGKVVEEHFVTKTIIKEYADISVVHFRPFVHDVVVALKYSAYDFLETDALVRHGAQTRDVFLHGEIDV